MSISEVMRWDCPLNNDGEEARGGLYRTMPWATGNLLLFGGPCHGHYNGLCVVVTR